MFHDSQKKTIYYDNFVKFYLPILLPKLSHPDPSVDRRSGFGPKHIGLKNLGYGVSVPYFFDIGKDKILPSQTNFLLMKILFLLGSITKLFEIPIS